jgi:hypothetical protein
VEDIREPSPYEILAATTLEVEAVVKGDVAINDKRWQPWWA